MDIDKTIYHIFRADVHFMTTSMVEDILLGSKLNHFFIIVGVNEENRKYFLNIFIKQNCTNYLFINKKSNLTSTRFISFLFCRYFKINLFEWEIDLLKFLSKINHPHILIHAECSVLFSLILSLKRQIKKNLVIWGSVHSPVNYSRIYYKLRKRLYQSYSNIVCLMNEDCDRFKKFYDYQNSVFIPYNSRFPSIAKELQLQKTNNNKNRILLGNSGRCIMYYTEDIKLLSIYKDNNIFIDCMLNYGSTEDENTTLIKLGSSIFGSRFQAHTSLWSIDDYYNFIKDFDIYISSRLDQSGLGAIYLSLLLGMKIFLAGNNYLYLKNLGVNVFHTDHIRNLSYNEMSEPLSIEEKKINYSIIENLLDNNNINNKWEKLYMRILSNQLN